MLPRDLFPFTITLFRFDDGTVLHTIDVPTPWVAVRIPACGPGALAGSFVSFGNGECSWYVPQVGVE